MRFQLCAGWDHTLVLKPDGMVWAWGSNFVGELGIGDSNPQEVMIPVVIPGLDKIHLIGVGHDHSMTYTKDGDLLFWGQRVFSDYSADMYFNHPHIFTPTLVLRDIPDVIQLDGGKSFCNLLKRDGTVWEWGLVKFPDEARNFREYDPNSPSLALKRQHQPERIPHLANISAISAGTHHTLALDDNGNVWAWGEAKEGQLGAGHLDVGYPNLGYPSKPIQVINIPPVTMISTCNYYNLALDTEGKIWEWGTHLFRRPGIREKPQIINRPRQVTGLKDIVALAAGAWHGLALDEDGALWAWGDNWYGELGDGTCNPSLYPKPISSLANVVAFTASQHNLALTKDGKVFSWGNNESGQLGDGTTENRNTPVQVVWPK